MLRYQSLREQVEWQLGYTRQSTIVGLVTTMLLLALAAGCKKSNSGSAGRAQSPRMPRALHFNTSLDEALARAKHNRQRVYAYFTGEHCGWCRRMEKDTHQDPVITRMLAELVCVKIDIDQQLDLQEEYRVYSIPRMFILDGDGNPLGARVGYQPPAEHAEWIRTTLAGQPKSLQEHFQLLFDEDPKLASSQALLPADVGYSAGECDLLLWFVDHRADGFRDSTWANHAQLLDLLKRAGTRPRIEHLFRWQLPDRWATAEASHRLPDLLSARANSGFVRKLVQNDMTRDIISTRLSQPDALSACRDFELRDLWAIDGAPHQELAVRAVDFLLRPRPDVELGPPAQVSDEQRSRATALASLAARSWGTGDVEALARIWDPDAPQRSLSDASAEIKSRAQYKIETGDVRLFGNSSFTIAIVECRARVADFKHRPAFVSAKQTIGTPIIIIMRHRRSDWTVMAVGWKDYDLNVPNLYEILAFQFAGSSQDNGPVCAQILTPEDGAHFDNRPVELKWRAEGQVAAPALRLLVQASSIDKGWPGLTITALPHNSTGGTVPFEVRAETVVRIWSVARSGRLSLSDAKTWHYASNPP